jgi:aspartyl protease family protein
MIKAGIYGTVIGISCAIPIFYSTNPQLFHELVSSSEVVTEQTKLVSTPIELDTSASSQNGKVIIPMAQNGHFVAEFKLNGRRIEAMVDTGATAVAINESVARQIGERLTNADFRYSVNTANGKAKAAVINIEDITIGRIRVSNVQAMVLEDGALDGVLIGMSFMNKLRKFSVENGELILTK